MRVICANPGGNGAIGRSDGYWIRHDALMCVFNVVNYFEVLLLSMDAHFDACRKPTFIFLVIPSASEKVM